MYRARVGIDLIPNRYIHDKAVEWHRKVHKQNMDVIMKRKAGTGTLDNNCPESATQSRGWRVNGRRKFMKEDRYKTIQRQNKVLLQRMTKVMTTGTDLFEYEQRPPPKSLNSVARRQRLMTISKRNKRLVHILETIKPYYSVEKWEEDRRNQEGVLKWMAKVHYRPSKDGLEAFKDRELKNLELEMEGPDHQEESTAPPSLGVSEEGLKAEGSTSTARGGGKHSGSLKKIDSARGGGKVEDRGHGIGLRKALTAPTLPRSSSLPLTASSRQDARRSSGGGVTLNDTARKANSRAGNLHRIKEAQQAATTSGMASSSATGDMQQVASMFDTVDKAKRETTVPPGTARRMRRGQSSGHSLGQGAEGEEMSTTMHKTVIIKKSNGDEPVVKVKATFQCLPDDSGLRVQISAMEGEEQSFTAETFLPIDDARMILSLNQKKKGPLSKAELVTLVTGLMENFELMETAGTISIIFRRKLEFSNEDQFFSMVNKNLTALQQLYLEQREEVRRASIDFMGVAPAETASPSSPSARGLGGVPQNLLRETRMVPLLDPSFNPVTSDPSKKLALSKAQVHFVVRDPVCGEVLITARVGNNAVTGESLVLALQSRVPTLALANRSAAVEYVGKVIERIAIVKLPEAPAPATGTQQLSGTQMQHTQPPQPQSPVSPRQQPMWKLEIVTE